MSARYLDQTLIDLAGGIIELGRETPLPIRQIVANLPMEFSLTRRHQLAARPPSALQTRALALPIARMSVTFDLTGGQDV